MADIQDSKQRHQMRMRVARAVRIGLIDCRAQEPDVIFDRPVRELGMSASRPHLFARGTEVYKVKFVQNPCLDGWGTTCEQLVGRLGERIDAPVPRTVLGLVRPELEVDGVELAPGLRARPGLHHAQVWYRGYSDALDIRHVEINRAGLAALHVLYSWLGCYKDRQFIYHQDTRQIMSVDHSFFVAERPWDAAELVRLADSFEPDPAFVGLGLVAADYEPVRLTVENVTEAAICSEIACIPAAWGATAFGRVALAEFIIRRREHVLSWLRKGKDA